MRFKTLTRGYLRGEISEIFKSPYSPRNMLTYAYILVSAFGILMTSYLGLSYSESISSKVMDDWCEPTSEGIGQHCFSDFYSVVEIKYFAEPWSRGSTYPPLAILISKFFSMLGVNNSRIGLLTYLLTGLIGLILPVIHMKIKRLIKNMKGAFGVAILIICAGPSLMALDRGNNVLFLFPCIYLTYIHTCQRRYGRTVFFIVVASLIKPQMLVLLIVPILNKRIWAAVIGGFSYVTSNFLLFLLFPGNFILNVSTWITNLQGYQTYPGMPSLGNYSFANAMGLISGFAKVLVGNSAVGDVFRPGLTSSTVSVLSAGYLAIIVAILARKRSKIEPKIQLLVASTLVILVPGTSFGYYLIFLLIPLYFLEIDRSCINQKEENQDELANYHFDFNPISRVALNLFLFMAILPWPFQWGMLNLGVNKVWNHYGIFPTLVGASLWLLPIILVTNKSLVKPATAP